MASLLTFSQRTHSQQLDAKGGLIIEPKDGYIARIAPERGHIPSNPMEEAQLVPERVVVARAAGGRGRIKVGQEACVYMFSSVQFR